MKILCSYTDCGPSFVRNGWKKVFELLGHQFLFWSQAHKPAFDVFDEYHPDLFIGTTYDLDRALYKCIASHPDMQVALFASAWGDLIQDIDLATYPITAANDAEKTLLAKLKEETGKPDFVFIHYHDNWINRTMGGWRSIGIEPISMMNAADIFDYFPGRKQKKFEADIAFVGGYWGYKSKNLNKFILPLCFGNVQRLAPKIKIFGNQKWPAPQYLGYVETHDVKDIFASATICPNVSEPHSTDYGFDVIERPFKVLASGAFCVSDYVQSSVEDIFGNSVPTFKTPAEFYDIVEYYLKEPEKRLPFIEQGRKIVLGGHTYFDRVATMLTHLDMDVEAARTLKLKEQYVLH